MSEANWLRAFPLNEIAVGASRVVKHRGIQAAVFRLDEARVEAVDNLCPHEGYPLAQGHLLDCVLTCAWHNYKFDLRDGACIQGEEAVRWFPTRVVAGVVEVDMAEPDLTAQIPRCLLSLNAGLFDRQLGRVARDSVRLLVAGMPAEQILAHAVAYDARHEEYGPSHALAVAADALRYLERYRGIEAIYPLLQVLDLVAEGCVRRHPRPVPEPTDPGPDAVVAGVRLAELVETEAASAAEGLVRGAIARGWGRAELEPWFLSLCADHFLDFGHPLIYASKAFDLLDRVGWSAADPILTSLLHGIVTGTREDTLPAMAGFTKRLAELEPRLAELEASNARPATPSPDRAHRLAATIVDGTSQEWFAAMTEALAIGAGLDCIADALVLAAAERMLRFDLAHDRDRGTQDNWLFVTHPLTHAHAVRLAVSRWRSPRSLRLLFQAGHFINRAKPLDLPADIRPARAPLGGAGDGAVDAIVDAIAGGAHVGAVRLTHGYLAAGGEVEALRIRLEDHALAHGGVRPIIMAHATKTTIAAFEAYHALRIDPDRHLVLLALVRFLASPKTERDLGQVALEALNFVTSGRPPRVVSG